MRITVHAAKSTATRRASRLATLGGLLGAEGSGAISLTRILVNIASVGTTLLVAVTVSIALPAAPALALETYVGAKPIGEGVKGAGVGQLELAANSGVAVDDTTGDVYVADTGNDRIDEFESDGTFMRAWGWGVVDGLSMFETCGPDAFPSTATCRAGVTGSGAGQFTTPTFIAVDNSAGPSGGDVYVGDTGDNLITKFSSEGALESSWGDTAPTPNGQLAGKDTGSGSLGPIAGVTVDSNGNLDVINGGSQFFKFTQLGVFGEEFTMERGTAQQGLAVDSEGNLFKANGNLTVEETTSAGVDVGQVTLNETAVGLAVDVSTGDLYVDTGSEVEQDVFSAPGIVREPGAATCKVEPGVGCPTSGSFGSGEIGTGAGLAVDASTHTVYVLDTTDSRIDVFNAAIVPALTEVKARSATLLGTIEPDEGGAVKCQFEWGTTKELGSAATCEPAEVPEGPSQVTVQAKLGELQPDTTYYYRLQAANETGMNVGVPSQVEQFTTPGPGIYGESVSDVAATSATLEAQIDPHNGPLSSAPNATTTYYFQYSLESTVGCETIPSSCASVPLSPGEAIGSGESDVAVSRQVQGLLAGTVYHYRVVALNEAAGETITVDGPDQTFTTQPATGAFGLPDDREWELVSQPDKHGALIQPISSEGLVQASVNGDAIAYTASAATESEPQGFAFSEQVLSARGPNGWVSRDITPPSEETSPHAVGEGEEYMAFSENLSSAVVQPDGAFRPLLSSEASESTPYLRTNFLHGNIDEPCVQSCYRPLVTGKPGFANVPEGTHFGDEGECPPRALCGPQFAGATPDLSHIVVESPTVLAAGSGTGGYEWFDGQLSAGNHLPELRAAKSEDGSWSYFNSGDSVYVSHGGVTKLIAVLSSEDVAHDFYTNPTTTEPYGYTENQFYKRTSRVSPDGRWFAFMSDEELTGYDNRDALSGEPDEEVYMYHAPENLATESGKLVCASCNPTGARPVGVEYEKLFEPSRRVAGGYQVWELHTWIAANVPGWTPYTTSAAMYQSRYLSDSGRLFFNSSDALVPKDVNGNEDVYEYEPVGVGSCTEATSSGSSTYVPDAGGCVSLISSGQDAAESGFLDASGNGGDVFFLTAAKLVPQDYDTAFDVYDAHECTSAEPCAVPSATAPPPCDTGDSCKPAPTPQPTIFSSPPSATFSGPGNLTPAAPTPKKVTRKAAKCRKGFVKNKRGKCVKASKKKTKKTKIASNDRRTSR